MQHKEFPIGLLIMIIGIIGIFYTIFHSPYMKNNIAERKQNIKTSDSAKFKEKKPIAVQRKTPEPRQYESRPSYVVVENITPLDCSRKNGLLNVPKNKKYCGEYGKYENDYWAGAKKECRDRGMRLPDELEICDTLRADSNLNASDSYWADNLFPYDRNEGRLARLELYRNRIMCFQGQAQRNTNSQKTLCIRR